MQPFKMNGTMVQNPNGTFTFTASDVAVIDASGQTISGSAFPTLTTLPLNPDGISFGDFATEDEAFNAAKAATEAENLSYCSADLGNGKFAVVRNNAIGFNVKRCQPVFFAPGGAEERDRENLAQIERDRVELERAGRLAPKSDTPPEEPEPSS